MELRIDTGAGGVIEPLVRGEVLHESFERGRCSRLDFTIINDSRFPVREGDIVTLRYRGDDIFLGVIFIRKGAGNMLSITAYDQLRYLKNKDTYVYHSLRASDVVHRIALDYRLRTGGIAQTDYVIPSRVEDGVTLIDIIENALDIEFEQTGRRFVLFDEFGKLTLKERGQMNSGVRLTSDNVGEVRYTSSIEGLSNRVKATRYDRRTGQRDIAVANDSVSESRLGILQHYVRVGVRDEVRLSEQAAALLRIRNVTSRTLTLLNVIDVPRVRGGNVVAVDLGGFTGNASVSRCLHKFTDKKHLTDLEVVQI